MNTILLFDVLSKATKILSYGASGLCFLLFFMAYQLIRGEQKRSGEPRKGILMIIGIFMIINLGNIIFVGMIGIPAISSNDELSENNKKLSYDTTMYQNIIKVHDATNGIIVMGNKQPSKNIQNKVEQTLAAIDTLTKQTDKTGSPKTDSSDIYSQKIKNAYNNFKTDTSDKAKIALINALKINTQKITSFQQKKLKTR